MNHSTGTIAAVKQLTRKVIAFNPAFADIAGSVSGGVFLSQAWYWSQRKDDGWFYKSGKEWTEETRLNRREQERARTALKAKGVLEEQKRGVPCTLYFRVNVDALISELIKLDCDNPVCTTGDNPVCTTGDNPVCTTGDNPVCTMGDNPVCTMGDNPVCTMGDKLDCTMGDKLYTEITSETTSEISFLKPEKSENDFQDFEQASPSVPEIPIPVNPSAEVSPPGGKGSAAAPVLYQSPNIPAYQTVNAQRWIQAWNKADRPGKWPAMSIGMMSSQRSLECLRQFIDHEGGDEDAAIATMLKRLVNAKKDPFWGSKPISAYVLTDPNKLFLAQFDAAPVAAEEEDDFVARMYRLYGDDQNAKP